MSNAARCLNGYSISDPRSVPIATIKVRDSPRLGGENLQYIQMISEVENSLPPILVHRPTMLVIDGVHRLRAAELRCAVDIEVCFFDGDEDDAFVLSVEQNIAHGQPLSRAERVAAAERILTSHPQWSDRVIAASAGLSTRTVARLRPRPTDARDQLDARIGRDGKVRPLDNTTGRERAGKMIADHPDAPLREIATSCGISPTTAADVRERLRRGESPVPEKNIRPRPSRRSEDSSSMVSLADLRTLVSKLERDPALRSTELGRSLLRLLNAQPTEADMRQRLVAGLPPHCVDAVARAARECAAAWQKFEAQLATRRDFPS